MKMNRGFREGMITHMLNPFAILAMISLMAMKISPETPILLKLVYSFVMALSYLTWCSFVNYFLTRDVLRKRYIRFSHWIQRVLGVLLIYISIDMFFRGF
jgi:threonine/homoserine/homoserine lactone efflux protein